jgi:hypothetical protein
MLLTPNIHCAELSLLMAENLIPVNKFVVYFDEI